MWGNEDYILAQREGRDQSGLRKEGMNSGRDRERRGNERVCQLPVSLLFCLIILLNHPSLSSLLRFSLYLNRWLHAFSFQLSVSLYPSLTLFLFSLSISLSLSLSLSIHHSSHPSLSSLHFSALLHLYTVIP